MENKIIACRECEHCKNGAFDFDYCSLSFKECCELADNRRIGIRTVDLKEYSPDWCPLKDCQRSDNKQQGKCQISPEKINPSNDGDKINNFWRVILMNSTAKNTVTAEEIDAIMKDAEISISTAHEKCTVVSVKFKNGFVITETSACVDKANYDVEMGTKICLQRIKDKLWAFEGYVLQKTLYAAKQSAEDAKKTTAKERVQQELAELEIRLSKLVNETVCVAFNPAERRLLDEQYEVMKNYAEILRSRLSIWRDKP